MANEIIKGCGIHHIAINALDFDKSFKFYTSGLGFKPVMCWGEGDSRAAMLDVGNGSCVELFSGGKEGNGDVIKQGEWIHLAFATEDVNVAFSTAIKAGATVRNEPFEVDVASVPVKKIRIAFLFGLNGEIIEFFKNI